jgi:hypothetical protein
MFNVFTCKGQKFFNVEVWAHGAKEKGPMSPAVVIGD